MTNNNHKSEWFMNILHEHSLCERWKIILLEFSIRIPTEYASGNANI